ncbi:hypothetical protein RB195_003920 [Necator americanus]|uniref:Transthyretin-like family protein n=1 Tax=Necator americanus TaxID=51031 RepID=A0ABR1DQW0_NECAM
MDEGRTDLTGCFTLYGTEREITNIDPKVNIYHKCNYWGPCYKKFGITIPDEYITEGSYPKHTFNIGTINLAAEICLDATIFQLSAISVNQSAGYVLLDDGLICGSDLLIADCADLLSNHH